MKTKFNEIRNNWTLVKNHCRTTVNKLFTENEPTEKFKRGLLIAEHTPIRLLEFDWTWANIPYWVSTEWARQMFQKFISTQRDDRCNNDIPRGKKPQETPVNFDGFANMQNLIDSWRKRLCYAATEEARDLAVDFKKALFEEGYTNESDMLVPHCVYRCGCCEMQGCGMFEHFRKYCYIHRYNILNISDRYTAYREFLFNDEF